MEPSDLQHVTPKKKEIINSFSSWLLALVLIVGMSWVVLSIRHTQVDNSHVLNTVDSNSDQTKKNTEQLKELAVELKKLNIRFYDCIRPNGKCHNAGERDTAQSIGTLIQYMRYIATCQDQPGAQSDDDLVTCVNDLAKEDTRP